VCVCVWCACVYVCARVCIRLYISKCKYRSAYTYIQVYTYKHVNIHCVCSMVYLHNLFKNIFFSLQSITYLTNLYTHVLTRGGETTSIRVKTCCVRDKRGVKTHTRTHAYSNTSTHAHPHTQTRTQYRTQT